MSSRVKRQAPLLQVLAQAHPHICKAILRGADKDLLQCLSECAFNLLRGNVALTGPQKAKLTKYKQKLRKVANKKVSLKEKHKIVQTGGFAPALLTPLIKPVIAPLAGKVLSGAVGGLVNKIRKTPRHRRFLFRWHGQDHAVGGSQDVAAAGTSSSEPPLSQHRYLRPGHASHPSEDKSQWWRESETIQPGLATLSWIPRPSTSSSSSTSYNNYIEGYRGRSLGCCSQTKHDEKKSTGFVGAHQKTTRHGLDRKGRIGLRRWSHQRKQYRGLGEWCFAKPEIFWSSARLASVCSCSSSK